MQCKEVDRYDAVAGPKGAHTSVPNVLHDSPINYRTEDRFRVITFFNVNMGGSLNLTSINRETATAYSFCL